MRWWIVLRTAFAVSRVEAANRDLHRARAQAADSGELARHERRLARRRAKMLELADRLP